MFLIKINNSLRTTDATNVAKMSKNSCKNHIYDREWILEDANVSFLNVGMEEAHDKVDMDETNLIFGENDEHEEYPIILL